MITLHAGKAAARKNRLHYKFGLGHLQLLLGQSWVTQAFLQLNLYHKRWEVGGQKISTGVNVCEGGGGGEEGGGGGGRNFSTVLLSQAAAQQVGQLTFKG